MKKGLLALAVLVSALFIASCSSLLPVAGATGTVGKKTGEASQKFIFGFPLKGEGESCRLPKTAVLPKLVRLTFGLTGRQVLLFLMQLSQLLFPENRPAIF